MFLFPKREEELWSETTELKHRKASWALTQPAVGLFSHRLFVWICICFHFRTSFIKCWQKSNVFSYFKHSLIYVLLLRKIIINYLYSDSNGIVIQVHYTFGLSLWFLSNKNDFAQTFFSPFLAHVCTTGMHAPMLHSCTLLQDVQ